MFHHCNHSAAERPPGRATSRLAGLILGIAAGAATQAQETPHGPAGAQEYLERVLEGCILAESEAQALAVLEHARDEASGDGAGDLATALDLAVQTVAAGPPDAMVLPRDPALLFLLARRLPLPTPAEWLPRLRSSLTGRLPGDAALLEWIAKAPPPAARAVLAELDAEARAGQWPPAVHAAVVHSLGLVEGAPPAGDWVLQQTSPCEDVRYFAVQALQTWSAWQRRARRHAALAEFHRAAMRRHPPGTFDLLQAAAYWLQNPGDAGACVPWLLEVEDQWRGGADTGSVLNVSEALLGQALAAFLAGTDLAAVEQLLERSHAFRRPVLAREDSLVEIQVRAFLLRGLFRSLRGGSGGEWFRRAIDAAPKDTDRNHLDAAFYGAFGPDLCITALRDRHLCAGLTAALGELLAEIEASSEFSGYGLLSRAPDQELLASWIPLRVAQLLLEDEGDPEAARQLLAERIPVLEKLPSLYHMNLLAEMRLLEGRTAVYLGDDEGTLRSLDAALALAEDLSNAVQRDRVLREERGEPAVVPPERLLWREDSSFARLAARVLLTRASAHATLRRDARSAAEDVLRAGGFLEWTGDRWAAAAVDLARRGFGTWARRAYACVEDVPQTAYNRACVAAFLGETGEASALLREHLDQLTFTPAGRALEQTAMSRDPDLEALWNEPGREPPR